MGGSSGDGILIGSLNPLAWGSTSNAQFAIADVGFSRGGSNKIYLGNGTVGDYGGILIAGKLGLGSTSPTVPLTVAGSALFSGSTPTTPVDGELIYDSSVHSYKYWNSDLSAWLYLLGSTSASTIYTGSVTPAIGYYDFLLPFLIIIFLLVLLVGGKFISRLFPSVRLGFLS